MAPRLGRLAGSSAAHDELLGGGAATPATRRLEAVETANSALQADLTALAARIDALERIARSETPRIGFVRYNAFDDVGSDLSYALALLTKEGDGVVSDEHLFARGDPDVRQGGREVPARGRRLA